MGRRGENIRYRKWDKRWESRAVKGKPVNGKTSYKYFYAGTYQAAKEKKLAFEEKERQNCRQLLQTGTASGGNPGAWPPGKASGNPAGTPGENPAGTPGGNPTGSLSGHRMGATFEEAAKLWLEYKKVSVRESTYATYIFMTEKHLMPQLGTVPVGELTQERMIDFLKDKKEHGNLKTGGGLSDKTICDLRTILLQIMSYAVSCGMAASVPDRLPASYRQPSINVLNFDEQKKLEAEAVREDSPFTLAVLLILYCGLRDGEICGIKWGDISFDERTVTVARTVKRIQMAGDISSVKTKVVIGPPKTDCSMRTIPVRDSVMEFLRPRRRANDFYVATGREKWMEPRVFLDRFKRLLKRAGVRECTVHTLRHTFATRCVENGVDIKSLSEIMGHSDVQTTLRRYVHPSMEAKRAEINKLPCPVIDGQESGL